jgi:hypothetical protein
LREIYKLFYEKESILEEDEKMKKVLSYAITTIGIGVTILQGIWVIKSLKVNERIAKAEEQMAESLKHLNKIKETES